MTQLKHTIQQHHLHMEAPVRLSQINFYHCDTRNSSIYPSYPYAKIIFVQEGSGQLFFGEKNFSFCKNTLILINPNRQKFSIQIDSDQSDLVILGIENFCFQNQKDSLEQLFILRDCPEETYAFYINKIIDEIRDKAPAFEDACNHYLELLLIFLRRENAITFNSFRGTKSNEDCENIKDYLDNHYSENITLDLLSEKSGMNKYYLVHSFTKKYARSPISYLNEKRIDESKKLLENSEYSISEISQKIGFSSQSYFSQAFKKKTLMTPNEYRRNSKSRL